VSNETGHPDMRYPSHCAGCIYTATGTQAADTSAPAPYDAGCQTAWTIASPNGATLSKDQAVHYIVDFTIVDANKDAAIDANEFKEACRGGNIKFWANVNEAGARKDTCPHGSSCLDRIWFCNP